MTHDKLTEATEAAKALQKAKNELSKFLIHANSHGRYKPYALKSKISITICDGRDNLKREVELSSSMVLHLYNQEVNRLRAEVHHFTTAFERI